MRWSGLVDVKLERIVVIINCVGKYRGWLGWVEDAKARRRVSAIDRNEVISLCGHEQKRWLSESEVRFLYVIFPSHKIVTSITQTSIQHDR